MKRLVSVFAFFMLIFTNVALAIELEAGKEYFLKTALHTVRGDEIYWINYMVPNKTVHIRAGEKVMITEVNDHIVEFDLGGKKYSFAVTEKGRPATPEIYDKYFTKEDINQQIKKYPEEMQSKIQKGLYEVGMTKEQMLLSVGCPAIVDSNRTFNMTLKEIMSSDSWVYYFNRFNRWKAIFQDGKLIKIQN